jgi:hypothetical protein
MYKLYGGLPLVRTRLTSPRLKAMAALRNVSLNIFTSEITGTVPQLTSAQWSEMLLDVLSNPLNYGLPYIYEFNFLETVAPRDFFSLSVYETDLITWDVLGIAPYTAGFPYIDPYNYLSHVQLFYGGMETTLPNFHPFQLESVNATAGAPFWLVLPVQTPSSEAIMSSTPVSFQYTLDTERVLPLGLRLAANNGTIIGTPLQNGSFPVVIYLTELTTGQRWTAASFMLHVAAPLESFDVTITATVNQEFVGLHPHVTGGRAPLVFSTATDTPLPPGLIISSATGVVQGTPTEPGTFLVRPQVIDANGAMSFLNGFVLNVLQPLQLIIFFTLPSEHLIIYTPAEARAITRTSRLSARFISSPLVFSLPPGSQLPPGLTIDYKTGVLSGTPVALGNFSFYLRVLETDTGSVALVNNGNPFLIVVDGLTCAPGWTDHDHDVSTLCVQCLGGSQVPLNAVGSCQLCPVWTVIIISKLKLTLFFLYL